MEFLAVIIGISLIAGMFGAGLNSFFESKFFHKIEELL